MNLPKSMAVFQNRMWAIPVLIVLLIGTMLAGAIGGSVHIETGSVFANVFLGTQSSPEVDVQKTILWQIRVPRVLVGALIGGGLALAGAVMQGVFRNPMADPGVIGISGGASLGAVLAIYTGLTRRWLLWLPIVCFAVACTCAFFVYLVATVRGRTSIVALLLAGIAVGGIASSLTSFILTLSLPQWGIGQEILRWLMGGLESKTWTDVWLAAPLILGGSVLLLFYARDLDVLSLGEEVAQTMGIDVPKSRRYTLLLATAVTAAAVAVSGTLVFVGLLVPHIMRLIVGPGHRLLMICSFLGGAILIVLADLAARTLIAPEEIRLGVITSLLGGPFFLYLLLTHKSQSLTT